MGRISNILVIAAVSLMIAGQALADGPPTVGTVSTDPDSGKSIPGHTVYFTARYSDPDGWDDLRYAYMIIKGSASGTNSCYVVYRRNSDAVSLRNDGNSSWYTGDVGSATVLKNTRARLICAETTASGSGSTLTVRWAIQFRKPYTGGPYNIYLRAYDESGQYSGPWEDKGDWEVLSAPDRAVWVWSMADDIVLDSPGGSRAAFFDFCAQPHGNDDRAVTTAYLSGSVYSLDLVKNYATQLRAFLADAHSRGLKIECLEGDKSWATPEGRANGQTRCGEILAFNTNSPSDAERFDGIHYDVEPHGLHYSKGDSYDWDADNAVIWSEYLTLLENCQTGVNTYNATHADIEFGADIAWWYDVDSHAGESVDIQSKVDYVAIMDYRETGRNIVTGAATQIGNGNTLNKKVIVGVETAQAVPPDPETISFYEEGNEYMEAQLGYTAIEFDDDASFDGFAIHFYEDTAAGEVAYRGLWTDSFPGYHPIVKVLFPNGDEGIDFVPGTTYTIRWRTSDRDTPANLSIDIDYSSDGGTNWTAIAANQADDGSYAWNTTGLSDGPEYRVRVTATDTSLLSGYDTSDYDLNFSSTYSSVPDWSNARNSGENGIRPIVVPDGDTLHMVWYWPAWGTGSSYGVYYKKSTDKGDTWGSTVTLAENAAQPRKPALAVSGNNLAVVWVEGTGANSAQKVYVKISTDGGGIWGSASEAQGNYSNYKWADFPDITIDPSNNIHVVWGARMLDNSNWMIHYNSRPIAGSWGTRVDVDQATPYVSTPAITSDANGAHLVWGEFNWSDGWKYIIRYRKKSGSWSAKTTVAQAGVTDNTWTKYFPRIHSGGSNKLHVVWQTAGANPQTDSSGVSKVRYASSSNAGVSWQVTAGNLATGCVPAIAEDGGELRAIYYVPSATSDLGDMRYRKSADAGSNWLSEDTITTDARSPYWSAELPIMVGFPSLASGSMVAAWRGYSNDRIMYCYKGVFSVPTDIFADLVYGSTDSIKVKWKKPSGLSPNSYTLYRSVNGQAFTLLASNIYDVEYEDAGLSGASYYRYRVKAIEGPVETGFSNISNTLYPGENLLVDYFEEFEGITYGDKIGTSGLTWAYYTSDKYEGDQSMRCVYTYAGSGWGAVLPGTFPTTLDISEYELVRFWVKGGTVNSKGIAVQFVETGRPEGNEAWSSASPVITSNTGWQGYEFYLNDFGRTTLEKNNHFDKDSIGGFQLFFGEETANGTYLIDRVELFRGAPSIEVTPDADIEFGSISGISSNHRFQTDAVNITYGGFDTPWTVRVWTDNSPGNGEEPEKAGLRGKQDTGVYVPLKIWCENYGPGAFGPPPGPDEENDFFWEGYDFNENGNREDVLTGGSYSEAALGFDINGDGDTDDTIVPSAVAPLYEGPVWLRVPEKDEIDPYNRYSWRRLCWNDGLGDDAGMGGEFDIFLGVDTSSVQPQGYETVLTVEYVNE